MQDQEVSGDAPRDTGPGIEPALGDPKGSRTPGAGAANGRRVPINIETPPLSNGTPISPPGPIPDLMAHLTDSEVDDLHAHLCAITGVVPAEERRSLLSEGSISTGRPVPVGSHLPASGLYALPQRAEGRLPRSAGPGAGTHPFPEGPVPLPGSHPSRRARFYIRLYRWVFFTPITILFAFAAFWAMLVGFLAVRILGGFR